MTLVTIDLGDVAGGHDPDDHVVIRAEAFRESQGGGITSTAEVTIPLVDGVGQAEVEPGPVVIAFRCRAVADTREKRGVVPDTGPVGIERVLENAFEYLPPVVNRALETIKDAVAAEVDAIKWDRGHVPLDATSISDLGVGSWNVSNDTRAGIVGTPGLRLGNLSIGSIGTSRTATFISQGTASEKPGMWVQAERLGVWSGWQQVLPAVVPPSDLWYRGYVDASHVTLNDLANGAWGISGRDYAVRLGLPADFGSLQLMQIGSSRSAFFIGQETGMWIATSQGQVWGEWKRPGATLDELNGVGAGLKTVPVAVSTGAGGAGELSGRYRVLTQVTAPVTRFRVHISTAHPMWEGDRGPSTLGTVYIAHRSGVSGVINRSTLKTSSSTVAAAGEWVSRWITHDLSRETLIEFQATATNSYNLIAPAWKQDGASWVQQTTVPLWVWLEAETYAETPTVALVGDSTGAGSGSHMPVWDSALHIHARREGFIPVLYASSGDLLEGNIDPEDRNYKRWAGFGPYDSVIIQAGSNDLHNGTTLSAMQEHYLAVTEAVSQLSSVVIGATVKPRYPAHPEYDSARIAYNNWLKTQPGTTRDVLDFSHAVAPDGAIDPADNADGAHLTSSGHQKMATAFDGVTVARVPLASKAATEAADQALGVRVDAAHWYRGALGSSDDLDSFTGISHQGLRRVTPSVGNSPGLPGWVETTYDTNTARVRQVFTSSSPSDAVSLERKYSGGVWSKWTPVTWHGVVITSGSADDLTNPHAYAINSTSVGNLPVAFLGTLETLPAGSGLSSLVQRFTSRESSPRTWTRSRTAGTWSPWVPALRPDHVDTIIDGKLDAQSRMSMDAVETSQSGGSVIVQSMSRDGRVGYNALSPTVRQTFDHGTTWEDVTTFSGNNVEWVRALPSGELMVETTGWVNGVSGVRRVWVSTGYTPQKPASATWEVTLTAAAPLVKFADWSISITDEMILLAEYGPKSGMVWGSGTDIIPEGQNARYVYQSLDNGKTWSTIFDLNQFLLSNGRPNADRQHLHGVAWDKWWQRIWVSFGDASGDGTNGVLYSDDRGTTWKAAYWTHTHPSTGWQVVGIQPMKDCVLFAGDMTPSGVIRLDRAQGKNRFTFTTGWDYSTTDKHLCHVISYQEGAFGEVALFAFAREGTASPSFIVATLDGYLFDILWQESGTSLPGIRSVAGPGADGTVIAAHSTPSGWVEVKGRLVFPGQVGEVRAVESMIAAVTAKVGQVPKWGGTGFRWSWLDQHVDLYDNSY